MSVEVADLKVYNYIYNGLIKASFQTEVNDFYSERIRLHFKNKGVDQIYEESQRLVKSWLRLCELSYEAAYPDSEGLSLLSFIMFENVQNLRSVQLLKYVQCADYNIEVSTIRKRKKYIMSLQDHNDIQLLEEWKYDLMFNIIKYTPEYQIAEWSKYSDDRTPTNGYPCTITIHNQKVRGEFTGYSDITRCYHFSLYDGTIYKDNRTPALSNVEFDHYDRFSLKFLKSLPDISSDNWCDIKIQTRTHKITLSRMTVADGEPYNNRVQIHVLNDKYLFELHSEYEAK